jgi:hypothetical protein
MEASGATRETACGETRHGRAGVANIAALGSSQVDKVLRQAEAENAYFRCHWPIQVPQP